LFQWIIYILYIALTKLDKITLFVSHLYHFTYKALDSLLDKKL